MPRTVALLLLPVMFSGACFAVASLACDFAGGEAAARACRLAFTLCAGLVTVTAFGLALTQSRKDGSP